MEIEDIGLVKINYSIFKNCLCNFNLSNTIISDNIVNKANELVNNYNCFVSNYDARSLWEKKKIIASNKNKAPKARPHIIYIDFSDDSKCKKEFISYLNKLTDVNKDIIYNKISSFINQVNNDILNSLFDLTNSSALAAKARRVNPFDLARAETNSSASEGILFSMSTFSLALSALAFKPSKDLRSSTTG